MFPKGRKQADWRSRYVEEGETDSLFCQTLNQFAGSLVGSCSNPLREEPVVGRFVQQHDTSGTAWRSKLCQCQTKISSL